MYLCFYEKIITDNRHNHNTPYVQLFDLKCLEILNYKSSYFSVLLVDNLRKHFYVQLDFIRYNGQRF